MSDLQIGPGLICTTTWGSVTGGMLKSWMDARSLSEKQGLTNCAWEVVPGTLVEKARNDAVRQMLARGAQWILMIDGDAQFAPESILQLLHTAYGPMAPAMDVVGAYCTLKGDPALPTMDTGTGTWESIFPFDGPKEVIRTGAAFLLAKRHVFERLPEPWFRMRVPARPIDFMAEVDNWARIKLHGENPFRNLPGQPWEKLEQLAKDDPSSIPGKFVPFEVGEDSGFCDRVRNAGMRIWVDTNVVVRHIDTTIRGPEDHKKFIEGQQRQHRQLCGLLS